MFKVKIWGMGSSAKKLIQFAMIEKIIEIAGVTDSFVQETQKNFFMQIPVYTPEAWKDIECDYVVICASNCGTHIKEKIINLGIDREKIIFPKDLNEMLSIERYHAIYQDNVLWKYFTANKHKKMEKWVDYFKVYDKYFKRFLDTDVIMCEIGVCKGGSLQMWKEYFGNKCTIIGIDIDDECRQYAESQINIEIGSQSDPQFWNYIKEKYPRIDILLDDGGHTMEQQITTFENMFMHISDGGIYLCEDVHTSYWAEYGGGYKREDSYIEYTKQLIDDINAYHSKCDELQISNNSNYIAGLHYYDSMVVIEKEKRISLPYSLWF